MSLEHFAVLQVPEAACAAAIFRYRMLILHVSPSSKRRRRASLREPATPFLSEAYRSIEATARQVLLPSSQSDALERSR